MLAFIYIFIKIDSLMNVFARIFLNSRKDRREDAKEERRKDGVFVRCRRTYVLNKQRTYTKNKAKKTKKQ